MHDHGFTGPVQAVPSETEARLALAIAAGRMAVWDFDVAADRIIGSPELTRLFGFPPDVEPTTQDIRGRYAPGERERIQAEGFAALLRGERFVETEIRLLWPDGSTHWALLRAEALFDAAGRPVRALGVVMDISERKRSEAALRAEDARLTLAKAAAGFGVWDWDRSSGAVTWSPEIYDLLGIRREDGRAPGLGTWLRALHRDDRAPTAALVRSALDGERPFTVDFRLRGRAGAPDRWIRSQGAPVPSPAGAPSRYVGINLDVTEQHRREEQLLVLAGDLREAAARAERERAHIAELSNDLFAAMRPDGEITAHNWAWSALLGEGRADLRHARFLDLMSADDRPAAEAALDRVRAGAPLGTFEARLSRSDDTVVWIAWSIVADAGAVYAVGRDVTLDKARGAALAQTQKMEALGQLTGGVAHDFNNLLQAVSGYLELIRRQPGETARVQRWADNALLASERGSRLTEQLLAFSRAQQLEVAAVPLAAVFADLADMLQRTLGASVVIEMTLANDDMAVRGDRTQLETALVNLAVNARDAMPTGGRLAIAARPATAPPDGSLPPGPYVAIAVSDTGTGMPAAVAARAFDPFFTTKSLGKGTGLGLSQVYGTARHAGGQVTIDSRPGSGTTVTLLLPHAQGPSRPADAAQHDGQDSVAARATVLVVDDDAEVRALLSDMLPALGYEPAFALDGSEALAAVDRLGPDAVILDFAMPGMNGAEVARALRLHRPGLPVVLASGYADPAEIRAAAGPDAILLRKPFGMTELGRVLGELLA